MRCLRCGYCCFSLFVVIVDDPAKGIAEDNLKVKIGTNERCQHLRGSEPGKYSCAIHGESWYCKTPCASYGQTEASPDSSCRIGEFVLKKHEEHKKMLHESEER